MTATKCDECGAKLPEGMVECFGCAAERRREEVRAERRRREEEARRQLGTAPLYRATRWATLALESATESTLAALPFASDTRAHRLRRAAHLIEAARREVEAALDADPAWCPSWPPP